MERELWPELARAVREVDAVWKDSPRYTHRTAAVVRVHLWSALHDRPTSWACDPRNWPPSGSSAARVLPDQSTVSRRTRKPDFEAFMRAVGQRLAGPPSGALVKRLDGKPLPVAAHSKDRDAAWGRGAGQQANGYKLHALWAERAMPEQWAVTPLDVCERRVARRFAARLGGTGYALADAYFDASDLHDRYAAAGHQLVAPRRRRGPRHGPGPLLPEPAPAAVDRDRRAAGTGPERLRGHAARRARPDRTRPRQPDELRRRAGRPARVGAADLAGSRVGAREVAHQRRPHPVPAERGWCIMFLSTGAREVGPRPATRPQWFSRSRMVSQLAGTRPVGG